MQSYHRIALVIVLFMLSLTLAGCGGATQNPIVPVEGKITLANGKKLPAGTRVVLQPVQGRLGSAMGTTAEDGSFKTLHVNGSAGAEEGQYSLKLLPPEGSPGEFQKVVPKQYQQDPISFVEVKAGMSPLDLKVPVVQ